MNKDVITKESMIKNISEQTGESKRDTRNFYNALEDIIFSLLSSVDKDRDVCIKLFEGINLYGKYTPEKTKKNNLTGKEDFVESRIKPKFNITRSYCEKLQHR